MEQKANCIKSLLTEQRELSLQAASHSLSAVHLKQRLNIYQRYFIALARFKSTKNDDCYSDTIEGQVDVSYQVWIRLLIVLLPTLNIIIFHTTLEMWKHRQFGIERCRKGSFSEGRSSSSIKLFICLSSTSLAFW